MPCMHLRFCRSKTHMPWSDIWRHSTLKSHQQDHQLGVAYWFQNKARTQLSGESLEKCAPANKYMAHQTTSSRGKQPLHSLMKQRTGKWKGTSSCKVAQHRPQTCLEAPIVTWDWMTHMLAVCGSHSSQKRLSTEERIEGMPERQPTRTWGGEADVITRISHSMC